MDKYLRKITLQIEKDIQNEAYTKRDIKPLFTASKYSQIVVVGQAPGLKAQESKKPWNDQSGIRLRKWMGVTKEEFYNSNLISLLPMDFYFPGKGKSGDLPPRKGFALKWHPKILSEMPNIKLILLVGSYANRYYLKLKAKESLTEVVFNYKKYGPKYFPIIHPSPRNQIWLSKNKWFEEKNIPDLKEKINKIIHK